MMKKILSAIMIMTILISFAGCSKTEQANELILVQAIGIDRTASGYKLTMQTYDTRNAGGEAVASAVGENIKTVVSEGNTIFTALKNSEKQEGEKVFTGHNVLIILGESVVKDDIEKVLDYFISDNLNFPGVRVVTTPGNASDIIDIKVNDETLSAISMEEIIDRSVHSSRAIKTDLIKIAGDLEENYSATPIPVVLSEKKDGKNIFTVGPTCIIKNSIKLANLNETETMGLNWLTKSVDTMYFPVQVEGRTVSVLIDNAKVKIKPTVSEGKVIMNADISYDIKQMESLSQFSPEYKISHDKLADAVKKVVTGQCNLCVDAALKNYKADILGVGKYLKFYKKEFYSFSQNDYEKMLSEVTYNINIKSHIVN